MQTKLPTAVISEQFRAAFGNHPAGVAVVTASGARGPVGITASSLISVSADPAYLAFNIARRSGAARAILESDTILVHMLTARNADVAALFAVPGEERFGKVGHWETLPGGEPLIHGLGVAMRCSIESRVPAGPATVVVAEVLEVFDGQSISAPLVYHRRGYHSIGEHTRLTA